MTHSLIPTQESHPRPTRARSVSGQVADDPTVFIGSVALITALYDTYVEHIGITETDGPNGPYIWCACGWRSDDFPERTNPGEGYAVHLTNAQHAASVKALQPIVRRVMPPAVAEPDDLAARVAALADDLAAYTPGHGDYQTAAVFVRALLEEGS